MRIGVVKFFRAEKGVGAISCDDLPPGQDVWVHYSMIDGSGYRELVAGERVELEFEEVEQGSFRYRATWVRRVDLPPGPAPS